MHKNGTVNSRILTRHQLQTELLRCEYCEEKPCTSACPANCSPFDFIMAARVGHPSDIKRAAAEIMRSNPLGGVCGLVCPDRFCMAACSRKNFDGSINIPKVQATLVEMAKRLGGIPPFARPDSNGKKVAVIGGGPAGRSGAEAVNPTEEDAYWREAFLSRPYADETLGFDHYRPAYRYGWESRARYPDLRWDQVERELESGWYQWYTMQTPALLTIQSGISQIRYATLKGIMAAKKKEIREVQPALSAGEGEFQTVERVYLPLKQKQTQFLGDGDAKRGAAQLAEKLRNEARVI